MNRFLKFFTGMKFSVALLLVIVGICIAGSVVNEPGAYFKQWWVIAAAAVLCVNLLLCSVSRLPVAVSRYRRAVKRRAGAFGSWLCHFGMLLVIIGFTAGQFMSTEHVCYGIPGSTQPVGDTGMWLRIDSFDAALRDDYTVEQYTAWLTVMDASLETVSGSASVNHPMKAFGWEFFQDSMGWANYIDIYRDGELMRSDAVCAGEYTCPDDRPELKFYFNKFYPDLARGEDGSFISATPLLNDPHSLFTIYYRDQIMGMDITAMDRPVQVNEYTFVMRDPVEYTLIVIKKDPTALFVGIAACIMLLGIFMSFYYRPEYAKEPEETAAEPEATAGRPEEKEELPDE